MTSAASVEGHERLRLFLGLRLPEAALDVVETWQREHLDRMRVVPRDHLHVTLAFLGHRPAAELPGILEALRGAAGAVQGAVRLLPVRYRETRAVAMLVCEDEGAGPASSPPASRAAWSPWASTGAGPGPGSRTSPWAGSGSDQDFGRTWPIWEHMFWFRPAPLLTCHDCSGVERSTRSSKRWP